MGGTGSETRRKEIVQPLLLAGTEEKQMVTQGSVTLRTLTPISPPFLWNVHSVGSEVPQEDLFRDRVRRNFLFLMYNVFVFLTPYSPEKTWE